MNISCEVKAHPIDVSIVWLRDGLQLPNSNTTNIKIFRSPSASYLQVHARTRVRHTTNYSSQSKGAHHAQTHAYLPFVSSRFHEHRLEVRGVFFQSLWKKNNVINNSAVGKLTATNKNRLL